MRIATAPHSILVSLLLCLSPQLGRAQVSVLTYRPMAAEYSAKLDQLVTVSVSPPELHMYAPGTKVDRSVALSKAPLDLTVSPDGLSAAVLHDGAVSYIALSSATVNRVYTIPASVYGTITMSNTWVYINNPTSERSASLNLATGETTRFPGTYVGGAGKYNPGVDAIYSTDYDGHLVRMEVSAGPVTKVTALSPSVTGACGYTYFSPSGDRIYTSCDSVYRASTDSTLDMQHLTSTKAPKSWSLTASDRMNIVALVPSAAGIREEDQDRRILLFESTYLNPLGELSLSDFPTAAGSVASHARWVFFDGSATSLVVVVFQNLSYDSPANAGVQLISLDTAEACSTSLGASSATIAATGDGGSITVSSADCAYKAVSDVPWIRIISGEVGSGKKTVKYVVQSNPGAARSGQISVGSSLFQISQGEAVPPEPVRRVPYSVVQAAYSRSLDKLILAAASPNELHIFDPVSGADRSIPLARPPLSLSITTDGRSAAVGHDGWVSYANLEKGTLTAIHAVPFSADGLVALPQSQVHIFSSSGGQALSAASGALTANPASGVAGRLSADGSSLYVVSNDGLNRWSIINGIPALKTARVYLEKGPCQNLWQNGDRSRLITGCGAVFSESASFAEDLLPRGQFPAIAQLDALDHSAVRQMYATVPSGFDAVQFFTDSLVFQGQIPLRPVPRGDAAASAKGRFVFWNRDSSMLIALVRADDSAGFEASWAIEALPPVLPGQAPFSMNSRGAYSVVSDGGSPGLTVGWGKVRTTPGLQQLAGLAIYGLRANGALISETTVPAVGALSTGRVYAQAGSAINTGIAIANPHTSEVTLTFYFADSAGVITHQGTTSIPANSQITGFLTETPFNNVAPFEGTFSFTASLPVAAVALRTRINERGEALFTTLPVAAPVSSVASARFSFPAFISGGPWSTSFVLVNTSEATPPTFVTIDFYTQAGAPMPVLIDGQTRTSYTASIPFRGLRRIEVSLPGKELTIGSAQVTLRGAISGVAMLGETNGDGITVAETAVAASLPSQGLRMFVENSSDIRTALAFTPTANTSSFFTLELLKLDGSSTGLRSTLSVAARGQRQLFLSEIPGFESLQGPFRGVLQITSADFQNPVAVIGLRTRSNERGEFLMTTTPPEPAPSFDTGLEKFFPHFADGGGYTTQFILMDVSRYTVSSTGSIEFYTQTGTPLNITVK